MPTLDDFLLAARREVDNPTLPGPLNRLPSSVKRGIAGQMVFINPGIRVGMAAMPYVDTARSAVAQTVAGEAVLLSLLAQQKFGSRDNSATRVAEQVLPYGAAHPRQALAAARAGEDKGVAALAAITEAVADPANLIPLPVEKLGAAFRAARQAKKARDLMAGVDVNSANQQVFQELGDQVRRIAGNQNDSLLDYIAQNGLEDKPYNPLVENKALQDLIEGVRGKPKRIDYAPYSPDLLISPGRQATFEDAIRMNRDELLGSIPDYGRGVDNPAIAEALRTPAVPPGAKTLAAIIENTPRPSSTDAFMRTPRVIKPFDLAGYEAEKAAIAAADARLAEMRRLRDSPGAIQEALPGGRPQGVQYEMFPGELNTASKQPKLAAQVAKLAEDTPVQMGLVEDLANSVGDAGTKYDRFVERLTAITKKEGEVPPMGSSFWTEPRGGSFTPDEVRRFFARARNEGILGKSLDAVLPEPNLSNVDIPRNLLGEPADLAAFDEAMAALEGAKPTPAALGEGLDMSARKGGILETWKNAAYPGKVNFAWEPLLRRIGAKEDKAGRVWKDGKDITEPVLQYLEAMSEAKGEKAKNLLRDQLAKRIEGPSGSSMNFTVPGLNAAEIDRTGNLTRYMEGAHPAVLNADGTPKVFYHGTQGAFDTFNLSGPHPASSRFGRGIYFTDDAEKAADYAWQGRAAAGDGNRGPNLIPSFVNIKNPLDIANPPQALVDWIASKNRKFTTDEWTDFVKSLGYDGVVANGVNNSGMNEVVAFSPNQVKSAIGNRGTYNPNDPSLLRLTPNMRPLPLNGPVPQLITRALTNQATAAPLIGGLAGGAAGATTGGITGALATPEDRWGGFKQGFAGGAALGAALGAGSFAYGLNHVTPEAWSNLTKHSWELARKDVVATTEDAVGRSILPTPTQLISFWKNQTVSTMRQFGQDGTWNRLVLDLLQGKGSKKLLGEITQQISERMTMKGFDRLSVPLQERLKQFGKQGYEPKLGMPIVESVAMHGLSRSKSVVSSALLSTFGPGNAIGGLVGAAKGAAMPEFSGMIRHANGALNRGFRETAFVDELDNKLIPLAVDAFKRLGYDLSSVPVDQLTRATVEQLYGAKVGAMWQKTMENMIPMAESRVRYLFGDYTPGQKGAIGLIEKITGPGMPLSSWAIRAYPVALDMAVQNPWVVLGVYQFLRATSAGAGKDGRPRWTAGKLPVSTEFPLLGAGARTLLGGQKGTAYIDPVGSLSPVGGDLFQPGAEQEGPQSLYQQVSEIIGRAGLPGLSPIAQGIAYMLGLDYKGPGNMSRTQGMENSLGLIPGNVDLPGWGDVALRAGRAKLSPAFAGTELGAKLGATGDKYPTVYDPVARRFGELVVKETGLPLDDERNRAHLYDLAAGTGELYDRARREVLLGGLARNAFSTTSPIGVATQSEDGRQVRREREGVPYDYTALQGIAAMDIPSFMREAELQNRQYKAENPTSAAYSVGSREEAESILMQDVADRFRGRRPPSPAAQQQQLASILAQAGRGAQYRNLTPLPTEPVTMPAPRRISPEPKK